MTRDLDLLADDVIGAAAPYLPDDAPASILAVELDRRPTIGLLVPVDGGAPRYVARVPATAEHADLVRAVEYLVVAWLNTLPQAMVTATGYALHRGSHLRVYVGRDSREMALAIADGKRIVELAHRVVENATALH